MRSTVNNNAIDVVKAMITRMVGTTLERMAAATMRIIADHQV